MKEERPGEGFYSMVEMSLIMDKDISDAAVRLYCFISSYANNKNGYCYLTHVEIQKILSVSRAQFYRNLQVLINKVFFTCYNVYI